MDITTVQKVILALAVGIGLALCEPPLNNQYGVPGNYAGHGNQGDVHGGGNIGGGGTVTNSYGTPLTGGHDAHQDYIDSQPKSYEFGYAVKDAASGNDFGRRETSDGDTVRGEYRVQLPDGRTQIVTYTADWRTGFHADVRYEGEASYPDQYNNNNNVNGNNNNGYNNGYNNGGNGYNDLNVNSLDGGHSGGNNAGYNYNSQGNNGNYNSGFSGSGNNNYAGNHNYNSNNNYDSNSLDGNYNYAGYTGNSFGSKSPVSTYGTPAFH